MTAANLQRILSLLLFGAMMLSAVGHCDEEPSGSFYVGAGLGVANVSEGTILIDDNSSVIKALVGYRFNSAISLEGTLVAFDDFRAANLLVPHAHRAVADGSGLNASVILSLPVSGRVQLTARAGVLFWQTGSDFGYVDDSGNDLSLGIGIAVKLTDALNIRTEYEALKYGDSDITTATAALVYSFGGSGE